MWTRVQEANLPQYITAEIFSCLKSELNNFSCLKSENFSCLNSARVNKAILIYIWFYGQGSSGNKGFVFRKYHIFV